MEGLNVLQTKVSPRQFVLRVLAGWLLMIALDFLLNAGLFAGLWLQPTSFLLAPAELLRRLPLGYLAFLIQAAVYVWLTISIGARTWKQGSLFGVMLGGLLSLASVFGLRSGTTASWKMLLVAWLIGGTLLATGACFMAGFASERGEKKALISAFICLIGAIVLIVLLQSAGLVPVRRMG